MRTREQSLEQLSEMFTEKQMHKAITQGYSDMSLHVMADYPQKYACMIIDSQFDAANVNKLTAAFRADKLNSDEFLTVMHQSDYNVTNEEYLDDFLDSLDTVYPLLAARCFNAVNYEKCTYQETLAYVESGAFYATEHSSLSVTDEMAHELDKMGFSLRACEGFNSCYDVYDLESALQRGAAIFVQDKKLAVAVHDMMRYADWESFREEVKENFGEHTKNLDADTLSELWLSFRQNQYGVELYGKIQAEYGNFIAQMKTRPPEEIIQSAYEISKKGDILLYCEDCSPSLSTEQYKALLSSPNILHEVYEEWLDNEALQGMEDIGIALEETADKIRYSLERQRKSLMPESKPELKAAPEQKHLKESPAKSQQIKSRRKPR